MAEIDPKVKVWINKFATELVFLNEASDDLYIGLEQLADSIESGNRAKAIAILRTIARMPIEEIIESAKEIKKYFDGLNRVINQLPTESSKPQAMIKSVVEGKDPRKAIDECSK